MGEWLSQAGWIDLGGAVAGLFVGLTAFSVLMGFVLERAYRDRRRVWDVPLKRGQLQKELIGTVIFVALWVPLLTAALKTGVLRVVSDAPIWVEVLTFFVCWVSFQWAYWFMHRAMHHPRLFFMHRWHHESLVTTPLTGLSMSPWEAIGWYVCLLGPAAALSAAGLLGGWGLLVFFVMHWYGNIVGHANAETLPRFLGTRLGTAVSGNVLFHALHHARFDGHYGFGTALQDRLLGTEFDDWMSLHAKVFDGAPMQSLRERGEPN